MVVSRTNRSRLDAEIEDLTRGWIAVTEKDDPLEYAAWARYKRDNFNCRAHPKAYTVPTPFPPSTREAIDSYANVVNKIRESIGWPSSHRRMMEKTRPILWWMQPKNRWHPSFRESEVPALELIRDTPTSPLRWPVQGD